MMKNSNFKNISRIATIGSFVFPAFFQSCTDLKEPQIQHPIPVRSNQAHEDMVDLTVYYNASLDDDWLVKQGANLSNLPKGVQAFAGAAFDVRGLIQLAGKSAVKETKINLPRQVKGIEINYKGSKLHFLQGTAWSAKGNARIGEYVLNYENGQSVSIPIDYQRNIKNWWIKEGEPLPTDADIGWTGENDAAHKAGYLIRLYKYTVNNPYPDLEIRTLDFVSEMTESAPFLIAITVEPGEHTYESFRHVRIDNPIIPRSPEAGPDLVDLSDYYNTSPDDDWFNHAGHDLQDLPKGIQELGGVKFDIRGMIVLAGNQSMRVTGVVFPESVRGIRVDRKGERLHFLQACGWSAEAGTKIGEYIIHYEDGQMRSAPILYQNNVMDWWVRPDDDPPTEAEEVWRGQNPSTRSFGFETHLIKYTWENPLPDVEITTIDFVSEVTDAAPFTLAITVD